MTNRIFSLPSGRSVVLKAPSLDALAELHGLKTFFNDRVAHDLKMEQMRRDLMIHGPDHKPLSGLEYMQQSTPQMREFINGNVLIRKQARQEILGKLFEPGTRIIGTPTPPAITENGRYMFERVMYGCNKVTHPRVTFSNSLDSFNRKAKKLKIGNKPHKNRVFTCGDLKNALIQLASEHEYQHTNHASDQPLTKHYML